MSSVLKNCPASRGAHLWFGCHLECPPRSWCLERFNFSFNRMAGLAMLSAAYYRAIVRKSCVSR